MLSIMVEKSKHICILPILAKCVNVTTNFELGVSNMAHSVFALVNFSNVNRQPKHVVLGLFQTTQIGGQTFPTKFHSFIIWVEEQEYYLCERWRFNFYTMTLCLKYKKISTYVQALDMHVPRLVTMLLMKKKVCNVCLHQFSNLLN